MAGPKPTLSSTEKVVLTALWDVGPSTVRKLAERLNRSGNDWAYTTVQTLLLRLTKKGYAAVDKGEAPHVFSAAVTRKSLIGQRLADLADDLCDGSADDLVMALVDNPRFTKEDLARFRKLIDESASNDTRGKSS